MSQVILLKLSKNVLYIWLENILECMNLNSVSREFNDDVNIIQAHFSKRLADENTPLFEIYLFTFWLFS